MKRIVGFSCVGLLLAALNLLDAPAGDSLFLKVAPDCVTTTVFQDGRIRFYRRVTDVSLYDAAYPTVMYYQDKLGGSGLQHLFACGYNADVRMALAEVQFCRADRDRSAIAHTRPAEERIAPKLSTGYWALCRNCSAA